MALPFLISGFVIPVFGMFIDKCGKRASLLVFSGIIGMLTYLLFIFINPIIPLITLGTFK
jgi:hypothetical protein